MKRYRRAVALEYEPGTTDTPLLSAKGEYLSAELLVKTAKRFGIPVVSRAGLAQALSKLEVDESIPAELFEAVAVVLNEVDRASSPVLPRLDQIVKKLK